MPSIAIRFSVGADFRKDLHARVNAYLEKCGRPVRAPFAMYRKTTVLLIWMAASYTGLVFVAHAWWQALFFSVSLALSVAGIGFNIPHDAGHGSYSRNAIVNRMMAFFFDLMGASSYVWHYKHNVLHHGFTNIPGVDDDINVGALGRLAPQQKHYFFHRLQHYYLWLLYGMTTMKWQWVDDYVNVATGKIGEAPIPRPKGLELVLFIAGKLAWGSLFVIIPLFVHPVLTVLTWYLVTNLVLGVTIAVVFQMAHTVEEADFVPPPPGAPVERLENDWATHQVATTVDFARGNKLWTWYLGGLNYQIEHHLFPSVSHIHYPDIAPIVQQVCKDHGLEYNFHPTFRAAIASHFRWLREMSRPPEMMTA
jgi:linoleoyl-CoA desaturase